MLKLLKLEWSKFRKNTVIMLLSCFFLVFFPCSLYIGRFLDNIPDFIPGKVNIYVFPHIWDYLGYAGNWMVFFFLGVVIIYTVTIEVSNKTMRQSIINGMSRKEFLLSKLQNIIVLATLATAFYTLLSMTFGWLNTEEPTIAKMMDNEWAIARFFLMSVAYMVFALMLAFLFRKAGLAVFFYLAYMIIIEFLLKILTQQYLFSNKYVNYYPMNAAEDLMPSPLFKIAKKLPNNIDYEFLLPYGEAAVLTVIYGCIFSAITWYFFMKRDM